MSNHVQTYLSFTQFTFCFFFSTSCFYFSTFLIFFHVTSNISNTKCVPAIRTGHARKDFDYEKNKRSVYHEGKIKNGKSQEEKVFLEPMGKTTVKIFKNGNIQQVIMDFEYNVLPEKHASLLVRMRLPLNKGSKSLRTLWSLLCWEGERCFWFSATSFKGMISYLDSFISVA